MVLIKIIIYYLWTICFSLLHQSSFYLITIWLYSVFILILYVLGIVESKPNGSQTVLKSMQNKRLQSKGPFIANVPVKHMVQNFKDVEKKDVSHGSVSPRKVCPYVFMKNTFLNMHKYC